MAYPTHLDAFVKLGKLFNTFYKSDTIENDIWQTQFAECLTKAEIQNAWFTRKNLLFAIQQWGEVLNESNLLEWQSKYSDRSPNRSRKVAIIMAGNIPMVGFHDFLCVLLSGHRVLAKLSSNDNVLLPFIKKFLTHADSTIERKIEFTKERLDNFDAVIATGSNNTSRYFDHYFGKYPNIIRRNRNSVAVLSGKETPAQLKALGEDIFRYFGLGCRSVSKLFVPQDHDFDSFFQSVFAWKHLLEHHKYVNNYDYNKAVYLMSDVKILDNGFLIVKEDEGYGSPIATLFYEHYENTESLKVKLREEKGLIQCVVSNGLMKTEVPFGETQAPSLTDYADGVDTMEFLKDI